MDGKDQVHVDSDESHEHAHDEMQECIEECLNCHAVCTLTLQHCIASGGGELTEVNLVDRTRARPDGVVLAWRYTDPGVVLEDRLIPYFIDWGTSPHPAATAARANLRWYESLRMLPAKTRTFGFHSLVDIHLPRCQEI